MKNHARLRLMLTALLCLCLSGLLASAALAIGPLEAGPALLGSAAPGLHTEAADYAPQAGAFSAPDIPLTSALGSTTLEFINNSSNTNNSPVVLFQKNLAETFAEEVIAWKTINNTGYGSHHLFTFSASYQINVHDPWDNSTPTLSTQPGQTYSAAFDHSGFLILYPDGIATWPGQVRIVNRSPYPIGARAFRDGKVLAETPVFNPQRSAVFEFDSTLWIGVGSDITEGDTILPAFLDSLTSFNLEGIASTDIVMTGDGFGSSSTPPYQFSLANVVYR